MPEVELFVDPKLARVQLTKLFIRSDAPTGLIEIAFEDVRNGNAQLTGKARFPNTTEGVESAIRFAPARARDGSSIYVGGGLRRRDMLPHERSTNQDVIAWTALSLGGSDRSIAKRW